MRIVGSDHWGVDSSWRGGGLWLYKVCRPISQQDQWLCFLFRQGLFFYGFIMLIFWLFHLSSLNNSNFVHSCC